MTRDFKSKVVVIIQARMASTRFYGKVLEKIGGKTVLEHVVNRARQIIGVSEVVVATVQSDADLPIHKLCQQKEIAWTVGDEKNVLERYYHAAVQHQADIVIRITSDCPLIDPEVGTQILQSFLSKEIDYLSNNFNPTFPHGLDLEVFTFSALRAAYESATESGQLEHVTPYIKDHPEIFKIESYSYPTDLHFLRVTVDEPEDLEVVREIMKRKGEDARLQDLIDLWQSSPKIFDGNKGAAQRHIQHISS